MFVWIWMIPSAVVMKLFHLFAFQGKYDEAGAMYERSLAIREKTLRPDHPDVAESLNNQAVLLNNQVRTITSPHEMCACEISCG